MGFLDNLAAYKAGQSTTPSVNPPEAVKVLETATAAEVANVAPPAAPAASSLAPAAAAPSAQESTAEPKTRQRRSRAAAPGATTGTPESAATGELTLPQAIELVAMLLPSGSEIKVTGRG
jgi:hypothetical protein